MHFFSLNLLHLWCQDAEDGLQKGSFRAPKVFLGME